MNYRKVLIGGIIVLVVATGIVMQPQWLRGQFEGEEYCPLITDLQSACTSYNIGGDFNGFFPGNVNSGWKMEGGTFTCTYEYSVAADRSRLISICNALGGTHNGYTLPINGGGSKFTCSGMTESECGETAGEDPENPFDPENPNNPDDPVINPNPDGGTDSGETSGDPNPDGGTDSGTDSGETSGDSGTDSGTDSGETSGDDGTDSGTDSGETSGDISGHPPDDDECPEGTHMVEREDPSCTLPDCSVCEPARDACLDPCMDYCAAYPNDPNDGLEDTCEVQCLGAGNNCMTACGYDFECESACVFDLEFDYSNGDLTVTNSAGSRVCADDYNDCCAAIQEGADECPPIRECVPDTPPPGGSSASSAPSNSASSAPPECTSDSECSTSRPDECVPYCSGGECIESCFVPDPTSDCSGFTPSVCARCFGGDCDRCCGGSDPVDPCANLNCNDGDSCTTDSCKADSSGNAQCIHTDLETQECTDDPPPPSCGDGICDAGESKVLCVDPPYPCDAACQEGIKNGEYGCFPACRDDCGGNDLCAGVNCNDGNACTTDSCNSSTGQCSNTKLNTPECKTSSCGDGVCDASESQEICVDPPYPCDAACQQRMKNGEYGCFPACKADCGDDTDDDPRCPIPVCAPIPEGCSPSTDEGTDAKGCPLNPCQYECPNDEEPDCKNNAQCENTDIYHLDQNPDCREIPGGENECGCASYECYSIAPVACCATENICISFGTTTGYGEDPEQFEAEAEWIANISSKLRDLEKITDIQERIAFCQNLGNDNPFPEDTGGGNGGTNNGGSGGDGCTDLQCPVPRDGCFYVNIPADANNCPTGCGEVFCIDPGGDDCTTDADCPKDTCASSCTYSSDLQSCAKECSDWQCSEGQCIDTPAQETCTPKCDVPPQGCTYDTTAPTEACACPAIICSSSSHSAASNSSASANSVALSASSTSKTTASTSSKISDSVVQSSKSSEPLFYAPVCGDGSKNQTFEQCDDGNRTDYDGCSSVCQKETRSGTGNTGGNNGGGDTGSTNGEGYNNPQNAKDTRDPSPPICGDGKLQFTEQCDDGNVSSGDGCSIECLLEPGTGPQCGDTILTIGEECDYGNNNADKPNFCRTDCSIPSCGDNIVDNRMNEQCDDGNTKDGDGCSAECTVETINLVASASICGNGILEDKEECDDSNRRDNDGCSSSCLLEIGICGDGVVQTLLGEQCEQALHDDSLPYECKKCRFLSLFCGDGKLDAGEECDEGANNADTPDAYCRQDCSIARCGDGVLDSAELCDDGNRQKGDGCGPYCRTETPQTPTSVAGEIWFQNPSPNPNPNTPTPHPLPPTPNSYSLAQLQPLIQGQAPVGDTGPAAAAVIGAGAASGLAWIRRKRR